MKTAARFLIWGIAICAIACKGEDPVSSSPNTYTVYAIKYGETASFSRKGLVHQGNGNATQPFAWYAWLAMNQQRKILFDTGFKSRAVAKDWHVDNFSPVSTILKKMRIDSEDITDIVITHLHWDHVGNVADFPNADIWVQDTELKWAQRTVSEDKPNANGVRYADLLALEKFDRRGQLKRLYGTTTIWPGIKVYLGGKHTPHIQWVSIRNAHNPSPVVLSSDAAYLFENIDTPVATGSTIDPKADLRQINLMTQLSGNHGIILPGHDPLVMKKFISVCPGIARISR